MKTLLTSCLVTFAFAASAQLKVSTKTIDPTCKEAQNGSITLKFDNAIQPLVINGEEFDGNEIEFSDLTSGNYEFLISDKENQSATVQLTLFEGPSPTVNYIMKKASTNVSADGAIKFEINYTNSSFEYEWSASNNKPFTEEADRIKDLAAGIYTLSISYNNGECVDRKEYILGFEKFFLTPGGFNGTTNASSNSNN